MMMTFFPHVSTMRERERESASSVAVTTKFPQLAISSRSVSSIILKPTEHKGVVGVQKLL